MNTDKCTQCQGSGLMCSSEECGCQQMIKCDKCCDKAVEGNKTYDITITLDMGEVRTILDASSVEVVNELLFVTKGNKIEVFPMMNIMYYWYISKQVE